MANPSIYRNCHLSTVKFQSNVDWQSTKPTILERNRRMYNNSDLSDVSFTCEGSLQKFYAHKYVLCTSSAVFYAMLNGQLADSSPNIHLCDADRDSFEQFLMFIYTEECELTAGNVVGVLYQSKKYIVPALSEMCIKFLLANLHPENVLDILETAIHFDEKDLEVQCWYVIKAATVKVLKSDSFTNISKTTLARLLEQDRLKVPEVILFKMVLKWIDHQCFRRNLERNNENRRYLIGELIYLFRFFTMSQEDFAHHVSNSGLLSDEESLSIYSAFNGIAATPGLKWTQEKRKEESIVRYSRFLMEPKDQNINFFCGCEQERICFSVSKDALLLGISLLGMRYDNYRVAFQVNETIIFDSKVFKALPNTDSTSGYDIMLEMPIIVKQNELVTLSVLIDGSGFRLPNNIEQSFVSVEHEGVIVTFSKAPGCSYSTSIDGGPFHEVILSI